VTNRIERIRELLARELSPSQLDVEDESHRHRGHEGAKDGRGHFRVRIVASAFEGKPALARHRMVYAALGDMMTTDIHALAMDARSPDEAKDNANV
jgi:BolA family transcriptional regulator, general stress-responsive regulator